MRFLFLFICSLAITFTACGQEIQNTLSYRNISSDHYFRINYENDLAFHTDYYYTQGVHFELVSPRIGRSRLKALFPHFSKSLKRYGIGLESAGYTPTSIFSDSILYGDRPFAGLAYLQAFMLSVNESARSRFSAILSVGLMGPAAGGYDIQAFIHRYTRNADPMGWKFQVKNEPIINYEADYEKAITPASQYFLLSGLGMARVGTLSTKAGAGLVLMAGLFNDPFHPAQKGRKRFAYVYAHPEVDVVGYDATLQGGPFTHDNPYVIATGDINRITFRSDVGAIFGSGRFSLGANVRYVTKEFHTGMTHLTGGVQIALAFGDKLQ